MDRRLSNPECGLIVCRVDDAEEHVQHVLRPVGGLLDGKRRGDLLKQKGRVRQASQERGTKAVSGARIVIVCTRMTGCRRWSWLASEAVVLVTGAAAAERLVTPVPVAAPEALLS